jgi:hypothetical protein
LRRKLYMGFSDQQHAICKKMLIKKIFLIMHFFKKNKSRLGCSAFVL